MADQDASEQAFYIEKHELQVDSDEEFAYENVALDDDFTSVVEEDLDTALRVINEERGDYDAIHVSSSIRIVDYLHKKSFVVIMRVSHLS